MLRFSILAFLCGLLLISLRAQLPGSDQPSRGATDRLAIAVTLGDRQGVKNAISSGADPNALTAVTRNPIWLSALLMNEKPLFWAMSDHIEIAPSVPASRRQIGPDALATAAARGYKDVLQMLLDRGIDVNARQYVGTTALMIAAANGDSKIVEFLLNRQADPNLADQHGDTPLMAAVRAGSAPVVRALLQAGSHPDVADKYGRRAVSWVARTTRTEILNLLLQRGAEVNFVDNLGNTPVSQAGRLGCVSMVDSLRRAGALGDAGAPSPRTVQSSINASLKMIQTRAELWVQRSGCLSCHHTGPALQATLLAKEHGFKIDDNLANVQIARLEKEFSSLEKRFVTAKSTREMSAKADTPFEDLAFALANLVLPFPRITGFPSQEVANLPLVLANLQSEDGRWIHGTARVPIESSDILTTAYAMRTLQRYTRGDDSREVGSHLIKGERWLQAQRAATLLDVVGQVCAFSWISHKERQLQSAVDDLRNRQLPDGSWAQQPGMNGDAYATGLALVALREAGHLKSGSPTCQRGVDFLLRTQEDDGSWLVPTRAIPLNGFLESGSPHDKHQFISFAATCWATMALVLSMT